MHFIILFPIRLYTLTRLEHYPPDKLESCYYTPLWRPENDDYNVEWGERTVLPDSGVYLTRHEYVMVECTSPGGDVIYRNMHAQILPKSTEEIPLRTEAEKEQLNIIFLGELIIASEKLIMLIAVRRSKTTIIELLYNV